MISVTVARALHDEGLAWSPRRGDRFIVRDKDMDDDVFVLSDMTIEVHSFPSGPVIGFNGTTEWALDSLDQDAAMWLPTEDQLRGLLGASFVRLEAGLVVGSDGPAEQHTVVVADATGEQTFTAETAEDAYGIALLAQLRAFGVAAGLTDPAE